MESIERREALRLVGLGTVAVGVGVAVCVWPESDEAGGQFSGRLKSDPKLDAKIVAPELDKAFLEVIPTKAGTVLHTTQLVDVKPLNGVIVAELVRADKTPFRVEICQRDVEKEAPRPIAHTTHFDFFIFNGGKGDKVTHEEEGLAVYALARAVAQNESQTKLPRLLTMRERWSRSSAKRAG